MKNKETGLLLPHQALILGRFKAEEARERLNPGHYETNFVAEVAGAINVGEDYEAQDPVPWKALALHLLSSLEEADVRRIVKRAVRQEVEESELEETVKMVASPILGKRACRGRVSGACVVRIRE